MQRLLTLCLALLFSCVLVDSIYAAQSNEATTSEKATKQKKKRFVPPGFEHLLEPQTTQIDVYYGNSFVISTLATFTPNNITLLNPSEIVAKLADLSDPGLIKNYLSEELNTNSAFVCLTKNQTGCGKLTPESVDVLFDENRFRLDLFIAPALLNVRSTGIDPFLPPSDSGLSLLNVLSATVNGEESRDRTYNLANSTTIAFKETRLVAISNINDNQDLTFDTLAAQREISGQLFQAGIFRANAGNLIFAREADFLGASISSSLDTRKDLNQSSGSELTLFLDSRSRVDILKDDRLISTAIYDTGNQILDTSRLPGGAYDIVLRIRDNLGSLREETRFYVKSNRLPPLNQTLYFLDFGEQVALQAGKTLPTKVDRKLLRGGISRRINENFGGELGVISSNSDNLFEGGIFRVGRNYDLRFNLAFGNDQARAASLISNFRFGKTTFGATLRETQNVQNSLLGNEATQASLTISRLVGAGSVHFNSRFNKRADNTNRTSDRNYNLRYEFPSMNFHSQLISSSLQVNRDNDDWQVLLGFRMSTRGKSWQSSLSSQAYYEEQTGISDSGVITNLASTWQDGDRYLSDVNVTFRAIDEQFDRTLESEVNYASQLGRLNLETAYSQESTKVSYGANFYTTFIANSDTFRFGGKQQARSALVLDIRGQAEDAYFDVTVNNLVRDQIEIGTKSVLPLAPYQTYEIGLISRGASLVDFENNTKQATLYPGNVVTLSWEASKILVAFGQIQNVNGEPMANALIQGVVGLATTDDFGLFQAELKSTTQTLTVKTRAVTCQIDLPELDNSELIATLGVLTCR